jgi:hypothetical protein
VVVAPGVVDVGPFATVGEYENAVQKAMELDEVDALIAIYACVGDCDPDVVGRGIRRGVLRAERTTGTPKPVLLCLMGAQRAVRLGAEGASELESRHVFPSYRFPESAARALSRAAQYAEFRSQPAGRVLWYEDVDAAAARQEVQALVAHETGEIAWLEGERATTVLRLFGVRTGTGADAPRAPEAGDATLEVRSDPSFGPLICVLRAGKDPVVRITPLTDRDIRDVLQAVGLPDGRGVEELLGRVSQMIEELPWLCGMTARVSGLADGDGPAGVFLGADVRMGFCRHDAGLS